MLPPDGQPITFDAHVKTLFRRRDRQSMLFAFDLWSYDDVSTHADAIAARIESGSMPCDGEWPADHKAAFARWIASGTPR